MIVIPLLLLAALAAPQEEPVTVGNVVFRLPAGWKVERKPDGLFLTPGDLKEEESYVVIVAPGGKADGSLSEGLEKSWKEFEKGGKLASKSPGRETKTEGGTDGLMSVGLLEVKDGSRLIVSLAMFKPADRYEAIIALSAQDAVFQRYAGALGTLLKGLRFRNVELPTYELLLTTGAKPTVYALFKDGSWLEACPAEGLDAFDPLASKKSSPASWGTHETKEGILTLKRGDRVQLLSTRADGALSRKDPEATFVRSAPATGLRFESPYVFEDARDPGSLIFKSDGSFEDKGLLKPLLGDDTAPVSGMYEISDNTLTLASLDGRRKRILFAIPSPSASEKAPPMFLLGGRWLKRA
jgi:hypothetical protein